MPEIDNLSITLSASAAAAIGELDKLATSLTRFSGAARRVKTSADSVDKGFEDVGEGAQKAERNVSSLIDKLSALKSTLTKSLPDFKTFTNQAKSLGSIAFAPVISSFQSLGNVAKSAYTSVTGLFKQISRVAFYRLIRSAIKAITSGLSDGIKNLYHFSETFNGTFYQSMNRIATSANYLKNSLAAMVSPLINAVTPVLEVITDRIVDVFNLINQFIARLTGQSTYTAAKKVASLWDDTSKKTSDKTKKTAKDTSKSLKDTVDEFRRYTLGFDELNILGKNDSNNTAGTVASITNPTTDSSTGKATTDYGSMFETRKISGAVSDFADSIRKAFLLQDWEGLGTIIGNKINAAIDSVNWEGLGNKVGKALNGVIQTAYYLLSAVDFVNIGSRIAEFLNGAIDSINFNTLGRLMVKRLTIIPDMIIGFFVGFNWGQAAAKLSDFVNGCFEEMTKWFKSYSWTDLGKIVAGKLIDAITNIQYYSIAKNFFFMMDAALEAASGLLVGFFDGLAAKFKAIVNWDSMSDDVKRAVTAVMGLAGIAVGAVGAILTFSNVNPALGIPMMIAGGFAVGTAASLKWDGLSDDMETALKTIKSVVYPSSFIIGCILAFSNANIPLGLGMMVGGAAGTFRTVKENWDEIYNKLRSPIGAVEALVSAALLTLGVLAIVGMRFGLGIGLVVAGAAGLATYTVVNWDIIKQKIQGPIGAVTAIISDALLVLGMMAMVGGRFGLGIGLFIAGAAGLATYAVTNWDVLRQKLQGPIGVLTGILEAAKLVLGIMCMVGGHFGLGLGLIVSGAAGLGTIVGLNWENLKKLGETALKKVQEGWDSLKENAFSIAVAIATGVQELIDNFKKEWDKIRPTLDVFLTPKVTTANGGTNKNATDWSPKFKSDTETLQRYIDNLKKGVDLDIRVALVKDAWTSVADWATNTGVDVNAKVALIRASWNTVSEWATRYIGVKINQSVGLQRAGWTILSRWVEQYKDPKVVNQTIGLIKSGWSSVSSFVSQNMGGTIYKGIDLYVNNWSSFLGTVSGVLHNWFPSVFAEGGAIEHGKVSRFAGGGIINAYAGGTSSAHGSLFLAGEAGPEIVGHVGGRTEVLNKSQLAATMYAAVNAAMAPAAAGFASAAQYLYEAQSGTSGEDMGILLELVRAGSDAVQRQNELMRQQNEYLRQINDKDWNPEISTASINRSQTRMNRRAGTTIVAVGNT